MKLWRTYFYVRRVKKLSFDEKITDKKLFYVHYRGLETTNYIKNLVNCGVPISPIYTTRKLRTMLPSLKPAIEKTLSSNVVYKISCTRCSSSYVGYTTRHLITRLNEHFSKNGTMNEHVKQCGEELVPNECVAILVRTNRGIVHLSILEALHIREIKSSLNTKDEYKGRCLRIRI